MGIGSSRAGRCRTAPLNVSQHAWEPQHSTPYRLSNGTDKGSDYQSGMKPVVSIVTPLSLGSAVQNDTAVLVPSVPERPVVRGGYVTAQQVYNFLNAEAGEPALHNPDYILILDCRSTERYKQSHMVTARVSLTVLHPELGCLITRSQLQEYSIILLYGEEGDRADEGFTPALQRIPVAYHGGSRESAGDTPTLQRCFFQLSSLGMDPVVLQGGYAAFSRLYPFLCTATMILLESERRALTIYPSEILEGALYQGSARQASDYRIIKNLHITHVLNATAECPDAFPSTLRYLHLRLNDDTHQDVAESFPAATRFITQALRAEGGGSWCTVAWGRSRSSALTLAFLMEHRHWTLRHAYQWLKERRGLRRPNDGFLRQLLSYEERLFGKKLTDLQDIRV